MLIEIQKLLVTNEIMSESQLAKQLQVSIEALTPMVTLLIKRGLVDRVTSGDCSGHCGCVNSAIISYRWLGVKQKTLPVNIVFT